MSFLTYNTRYDRNDTFVVHVLSLTDSTVVISLVTLCIHKLYSNTVHNIEYMMFVDHMQSRVH